MLMGTSLELVKKYDDHFEEDNMLFGCDGPHTFAHIFIYSQISLT